MSLKLFHILFITLCLALMSFLGAWSYAHRSEPMAALAGLCGLGGIFYLRYFWSKYKNL